MRVICSLGIGITSKPRQRLKSLIRFLLTIFKFASIYREFGAEALANHGLYLQLAQPPAFRRRRREGVVAKAHQASVISHQRATESIRRSLLGRSSSTAQPGERRKSERVSRCTVFVHMNHGIFAASSSWPCAAQRAVLQPLAPSYFPTISTEARSALLCFTQASCPTSSSGCEELPTLVPRLSCD